VQGRHRNGRPVASLYFLAGGFGAMDGTDGPATMPGPSNMGVVPTEIWESMTSMTIEKRTLLPNSGGAGQYRGGLGQEAVLRNDTGNPLTVSFMGMRTQFAAVGYRGGEAGEKRRYEINGKPVSPKGRYVLQPGDVVSVFEAGGGGFGPASERDHEATLRDVRKGYITAEHARQKYNLVIEPAKAR
jgi:N-methylhydantoinase B